MGELSPKNNMMEPQYSIIELFKLYHRQIGFGFIAALLCTLRAWHDGKSLKVFAFDATVCALFAGGADELLGLFGLPEKWGYFAAIFIGVFGWRIIMHQLRGKFPSLGDSDNVKTR